MRLIVNLLVVGVLSACGAGLPSSVWPGLVECGKPLVPGLVDTVLGILMKDGRKQDLSPESEAALEKLASTQGVDAVACALKAVIEGLNTSKTRASRGDADAAAVRGERFLNHRGVWSFSP